MTTDLNAKDALNMTVDQATHLIFELENWLYGLEHNELFFSSKGRPNPAEQIPAMMLSMFITMLDTLETKQVFGSEGWREKFNNRGMT